MRWWVAMPLAFLTLVVGIQVALWMHQNTDEETDMQTCGLYKGNLILLQGAGIFMAPLWCTGTFGPESGWKPRVSEHTVAPPHIGTPAADLAQLGLAWQGDRRCYLGKPGLEQTYKQVMMIYPILCPSRRDGKWDIGENPSEICSGDGCRVDGSKDRYILE